MGGSDGCDGRAYRILSKRYGGVQALDGLDLTVGSGEMVGFLGPNGAGKSTTIRLLLGLARPTAGRAWIFDTDAADVAAAHRTHRTHRPFHGTDFLRQGVPAEMCKTGSTVSAGALASRPPANDAYPFEAGT